MIPKFRAWWIQDEVMTHIYTLEFLQGGIRVSDGCWHEKFLGDEVILMQSTGLKDKNGVEIFEGDVGWDDHLEVYGKVIFDEGKFIYEWENICDDLCEVNADIEVIGNIYENPELLEVEG